MFRQVRTESFKRLFTRLSISNRGNIPLCCYSTNDGISFYDDEINKYVQESIRPVTLKQLVQFGQPPLNTATLLDSARYTKSELPVRLARRVKAFQNLPFIVGTNPYIMNVYNLYCNSFNVIRNFPEINDDETDREFTQLLKQTVNLHAENIPTLARGFQECKKYMSNEAIKRFLDDLIRARIGIRLIAEQHIALHERSDPNFIGIIDARTHPENLIRTRADFVQSLCEVHYGSFPEICITGQTDTRFAYVPVHLEYIIAEILKNACRATVELSQKIGRKDHPAIEVTISRGKSNIGIRVRDQGGGISAKDLPSIFEYSYTTAKQENYYGNVLGSVTTMTMQAGFGGPIAGLGYGLPLARLYAGYFGGSMNLVSLNDHGCDVFVKLKQINEILDEVEI